MNKRREAVKKAIRELRYDEMIGFAGLIASWLPAVGDEDDNARNLADDLSSWAAEPENTEIRLVKSDRA